MWPFRRRRRPLTTEQLESARRSLKERFPEYSGAIDLALDDPLFQKVDSTGVGGVVTLRIHHG